MQKIKRSVQDWTEWEKLGKSYQHVHDTCPDVLVWYYKMEWNRNGGATEKH
jgi:hypothetical protein